MADEPIKVEGASPPASPPAPVVSPPGAESPPQSSPAPLSPQVEVGSAAQETKVEEPKLEPTLLDLHDAKVAETAAAAEADRVAKLAEISPPIKIPQIPPSEEKPAELAAELTAELATEKTPDPAKEVSSVEPFEFTDFTIPDDFQKEYEQGQDRIASFKEVLTKRDFNEQQRGQALLDMHAEAMRSYAAQVEDRQHKVWNDYQKREQQETMSDPVIGGSRFETSMGLVAKVRDLGITNDEERAGINEWLSRTGAGSNRWFLRWAHNLARFVTEPTNMPVDIKPPPDAGQRPGRKSSVLYDNPRSN